MHRLLLLGLAGALAAAPAVAQLHRMELLLELETMETFGSPAWTSLPVNGRTHLTLLYQPDMIAPAKAPGTPYQTYLPRHPHPDMNYVSFFGLRRPIEQLVVSDTALRLDFFDAPTQTRLEVELVFRTEREPGYRLPAYDPEFEDVENFPDFATKLQPSEIPGAPAVSTVRFSTEGGFGFEPGGYVAELNDPRYFLEVVDLPPGTITPVPEPATYAAGALLALGGAVAWRRRRRRSQDGA